MLYEVNEDYVRKKQSAEHTLQEDATRRPSCVPRTHRISYPCPYLRRNLTNEYFVCFPSYYFHRDLQLLHFRPQCMLHQMLLERRMLQCLKKGGWCGTWVSIALHSAFLTIFTSKGGSVTCKYKTICLDIWFIRVNKKKE
jgi:hypothetical protein